MSTPQPQGELAFFDIDTQYDFMDPSGALYVPEARAVAPHILRFVSLAGEQGIRLFASVDAHPEDDPEFEEFPPHCVVGTHGQMKIQGTLLDDHVAVPVEPELRTEQIGGLFARQQIVFEKQSYDVFDNPNTRRILAASGATRYVVFGVATDYCVRAAALGLCKCGYDVTIVEDAIRGIAPDTAQAACDEMRAAGARFQTTEQALAKLEG